MVCNLESDDCLLIVVPARLYSSVGEKTSGAPPVCKINHSALLCRGGWVSGRERRKAAHVIVVLEPYVAVSKVVRLEGNRTGYP